MRRRSRLIPCAALAWFVLLPLRPAHAAVAHAAFTPASPTPEDVIAVRVTGGFPDLCWSVAPADCDTGALAVIRIRIHAADSWSPGSMCQDEPVSYDLTCIVGPLLPGDYTLEVVEELATQRASSPGRVMLPLSVSPVVSTDRPTWGRLKILAREP